MKVSRWLMPVLVTALLFGSWGVGEWTGYWSTSGRTEVAEAQLAPADLKGWMTIGVAAKGLGMTVPELLALVGAGEGAGVTAETALKDLEGKVPDFSLTTLRTKVADWLAARSGTPVVTPSATPTQTKRRRRPQANVGACR